MGAIINIEIEDLGGSLWSTPEGESLTCLVVDGEGVQELGDLVVVEILEHLSSELDALIVGTDLVDLGESLDVFQSSSQSSKLSSFSFLIKLDLDFLEESFSVVDIGLELSIGFSEVTLKLVSGPLDGVLNLVGEVLQSTERDTFFRWINRVTITLSESGEDDLGVALGSEGSTFEEGFSEPDALGVNKESGLDIVDGVDGEIETVPEIVIEETLGFWGDSVLDSLDLEIGVEDTSCVSGALSLGLSDVVWSEEELSVEVGDLNIVVIGDGD